MRMYPLNKNGFSLTELIVVVAIIVIMGGIVGLNMKTWLGKARVEEQVKRMYADLVSARTQATTVNRDHFLRLNLGLNQYQVWDDTNPGPDGNGQLETTAPADTRILQVTCSDPIWTDIGVTPPQITFDTRGLISPGGSIRITSTFEPAIDCVVLSSTRIRMGRWNNASSACIP